MARSDTHDDLVSLQDRLEDVCADRDDLFAKMAEMLVDQTAEEEEQGYPSDVLYECAAS